MFSRAPILVQHPLAGGGERDHAQLLDQGEGAAGDEEDEPSPLDQEDLLVHNVQREKARCVRYVDLPNRAVGEEVTLGHLGEDFVHWVNLGSDHHEWTNLQFFDKHTGDQIRNSVRLKILFGCVASYKMQ